MLRPGRVVRSIAGHDKDRFYMIVSVTGGKVTIADGKARKLEKPKAKNPLHVRVTDTVLDPGAVTTDKGLRLALRAFNAPASGKAGEEGGF